MIIVLESNPLQQWIIDPQSLVFTVKLDLWLYNDRLNYFPVITVSLEILNFDMKLSPKNVSWVLYSQTLTTLVVGGGLIGYTLTFDLITHEYAWDHEY